MSTKTGARRPYAAPTCRPSGLKQYGPASSTRLARHPRILGVSHRTVARRCDAGELWCWHRPGGQRRVALDIDGTERLLGRGTPKSRRAAAAQR